MGVLKSVAVYQGKVRGYAEDNALIITTTLLQRKQQALTFESRRI